MEAVSQLSLPISPCVKLTTKTMTAPFGEGTAAYQCIMAEMAQSDHFPKKMAGEVILSSVYLMPTTNVQIDEEYCGGLNESYCFVVYYNPHGRLGDKVRQVKNRQKC